jgi:hypothetical protein
MLAGFLVAGARLRPGRDCCYGRIGMSDVPIDIADTVNRLVDEYRHRCLWFLRKDYYPMTDEERLRVLGYIQRHGDRRAYVRAAEVRRWLSRPSNAPSAAS